MFNFHDDDDEYYINYNHSNTFSVVHKYINSQYSTYNH